VIRRSLFVNWRITGVSTKPMTIAAGIELPEGAIGSICRRYQVRELSLFGSAARAAMRPDSDFDLLVDFLPGARPGLLGVGRLSFMRINVADW
jgi:predicted nucleotidyltransferase